MLNMNNRTEALGWRTGIWLLMIPAGSFLFIWHSIMGAKTYLTAKGDTDVEREMKASSEMVKNSEFLKDMDTDAAAEGEEHK
jgi:hypothetical protein